MRPRAARGRLGSRALLLLAAAALARGQSDSADSDAAAAGTGGYGAGVGAAGGGSSDGAGGMGGLPASGGAVPAATGVAPGGVSGAGASAAAGNDPWHYIAPPTAAGAAAAAAGASTATGGYVWRGPTNSNSSAPSPHAPPSWMTKKWPPQPSPPPAPPLREMSFLALADWGGQTDWPMTTEAQTTCAPVMGAIAAQTQAEFVLSAGDNFYDAGIVGARPCAARSAPHAACGARGRAP
jgi:hypothetical protein